MLDIVKLNHSIRYFYFRFSATSSSYIYKVGRLFSAGLRFQLSIGP